jgi:hypothetical protein
MDTIVPDLTIIFVRYPLERVLYRLEHIVVIAAPRAQLIVRHC